MRTFLFAFAFAILGAASGVAAGAAKPYALDTCLYSGEKLGEMGAPITTVYEGQEIKFCCKSCESAFQKDPAAGIKKYETAVQAKSH